MFKKVIGILLLVIIIAAGFWYYKTNIEGISFIGKIVKEPKAYEGKMITIKGTVTERVQFMVMKYFKLKDRTGEIMVVTEDPLPSVGDKIAVKGMVHDAFSLGGEQILVFMEKNGRTTE
jgi:hypothetical protein